MGTTKKTGKRKPDRGDKPRQITTIHFVDQHQDFTSWDLDENGLVIACRPFQGWVWCNRNVLNFDKLRVGEFVIISPPKGSKKGKPSTIIHPIERITTQLTKRRPPVGNLPRLSEHARRTTGHALYKTERQALIQIAKTWAGHSGVNFATTSSEDIYLLVMDARNLDDSLLDHYEKILEALNAYHRALDNREHAGVAADKFIKAVQEIANRPWERGASIESRKSKIENPGGSATRGS